MMMKGVGKPINVLFDIIDYTVLVRTLSIIDLARLLAIMAWVVDGETVE